MSPTLSDRIHSHLQRDGDKTFLRFIRRTGELKEYTYRAAVEESLKRAALFDKFSVPAGRTVIFVLSDPEEIFLFTTAALLTGRVPVISAHPSAKLPISDFARTLLPLIANADPALIFSDEQFAALLSQEVGRRVATAGDLPIDSAPQPIRTKSDPPLFIQYSSGTTGTKKGVCISEAQLLWQVDAYARAIGLRPDDHIVSWLPYYHDMGLLTALLTPLLTATTVTVMSPFEWVHRPMLLLEVLSRDRGTLCWLPNFAYNFLACAARRHDLAALDLTSLRGVVNCSEPVSADSHALFLSTFARCGLRESALAASYAMAETTFAVTSGGFGQPLRRETIDRKKMMVGREVEPGEDPVVSSGRVLNGVTVGIFGSAGERLPERTIGEIGVISPSVMSHYFDNEELTRRSFHGAYFMTGDLGFVAAGELFVSGRSKDLIITAGRNIYPQDIEAVVNDIDGVIPGRCVAFGVFDPARGTESVVVLAESATEAGPARDRIERRIAHDVTAHFDIAIADVRVVEPRWLEKSTSGKIARGRNRERYLNAREPERRTAAATNVRDVIRESIFQTCGKWLTDDTAALLTSGLIDSLGLTSLMVELEARLGRDLPMPHEVGYATYDTIENIAGLIESGRKPAPTARAIFSDRQTKLNYFLEGRRNFTGVILGTSRVFPLRAAHLEAHGLHAFHFAGSNVNIEEVYCMLRLMTDLGRTKLNVAILGIDPMMFVSSWPLDVRFMAVPRLTTYLEREDQMDGPGLQWVTDAAQLDLLREHWEKVARMRYREFDVGAVFDTVHGDIVNFGPAEVRHLPRLTFDAAAFDFTQFLMFAKQVDGVHPRRLAYLRAIIDFCAAEGILLHVYSNPLHPRFVALLKEETRYLEIQSLLLSEARARRGAGIHVHDLPTPIEFGGDPDDFHDGTHMWFHNGSTLLDFLMTHARP